MEQMLMNQLKMQIEQQLEVKIVDVQHFTIPYSVVDITYTPIIKKRMDILMKMLLTSYQSGVFTDAEQLASILMVEPLFINDLTKQMESSKLIVNEDTVTLTAKGNEQLAQGIYEEQLPEATAELMYSSLHEQFFNIDSEQIELVDELPEPLQSLEEQDTLELPEEQLMEAVAKVLEAESEEQQVQAINATEIVEYHDFPVALFICLDQKNDRIFSRAYNLYVDEWDDKIATYIDKLEITNWRKQYM